MQKSYRICKQQHFPVPTHPSPSLKEEKQIRGNEIRIVRFQHPGVIMPDLFFDILFSNPGGLGRTFLFPFLFFYRVKEEKGFLEDIWRRDSA
ncbi:hypothetical protein CDAR_454531 [Caerostris darwini]|uniref:Uncharacterized protein n=1 Tax=Caerostris darwini TaxID=1538125 RepID=A0AAV4TVL7_9ARAC|nr:hypothetical protein CDAR_454531 [Caerostris darwini]